MKILVVIVNYGTNQLKYLERMIKEFQSMKYDIDIVVHSNIPLSYEGVEVKIIKLDDYEKLPLTTRRTIFERRKDYDLYIYSENDQLFTQNNIESFLKVTEILPRKYIAGFMRYEKIDNELYYPDYYWGHRWDKYSVFKIGKYAFAIFSNTHQGSFILTREQLNQVIKKFDFLNGNLEPKYSLKFRVAVSIFYHIRELYRKHIIKFDIINSENLFKLYVKKFIDNFIYFNRLYKYKYSIKCKAGTEVYTNGGFIKVIPISHFDDFLIYHMPNSYRSYRGSFCRTDDFIRRDLHRLIEIEKQVPKFVKQWRRFLRFLMTL